MAIICVRGGSISAGYRVKTSYIDMLSNDEVIKQHKIINISKIGDSSFEGVWQFDNVILHKPDILILHFGMDDIYRPVYRSEFKENLVRMVQKARAVSIPHIILPTLHLVKNQYDMDAVDVFTRTAREVALDMNCLLATVHIEWINYLYETGNSIDSLLTIDDRYPNEQGHFLIAEAIKKKLLPLLT
ncbi:MAG: SGNH/GDSL hydrolase family protein [Spirochaetes bacterium]|nr:SGNH/GDSL hydrolase family protein [Spirochaetota bacterium]